ncbi:MAG TPA: YceI family protein [Saprospiraceae bacterium]|nr:YceI family protein [Saprospiraceae bacterium]
MDKIVMHAEYLVFFFLGIGCESEHQYEQEGLANEGSIECTGNLTIAGTTKPVTLTATVAAKDGGILHCTGSKTFKMSEYQVEPPTFMFGTVKTGDEITVTFNVDLSPVKA